MPTQKQSADLNLSPSETVSSYEPAVIADGYKPVSIEKTDDASITEAKLNPDPVAGIAPSPLDNVEAMLRNMHASIPAETKENATVSEASTINSPSPKPRQSASWVSSTLRIGRLICTFPFSPTNRDIPNRLQVYLCLRCQHAHHSRVLQM